MRTHPYRYDPLEPEKLENRIDEFFKKCEEKGDLPRHPALLLYLGISKDTYLAYIKSPDIDNNKYNIDINYTKEINGKKRMAEALKKAELKLEDAMTQEALKSRSSAAIFLLKQRPYGGYTDRQDVGIGGDIPINIQLKGANGKDFSGD